MARPRIVLADDHSMLLAAFETLLTPDFDIVGGVADGRALLDIVERLHPEAIVLDVTMPLLNGLDAAREIKRRHPRIKIVFVTMNEDPEIAAEALRLGASAFLSKRSAGSELKVAINEALNGRTYVTPLVTAGMVDSLIHGGDRSASPQLTLRQREVLQLLAEGRSMKQVAAVLNVTPRTVAFHKYRMMVQLRISTTAELIQFAVRHHFV